MKILKSKVRLLRKSNLNQSLGLYLPHGIAPDAIAANNETKRSALLTRWISILSLIISGVSALFVLLATEQSDNQFRMDERAWVELASIKSQNASSDKSSNGAKPNLDVFAYDLSFRNFGKTPAYDLSVRGAVDPFFEEPTSGEIDSELLGIWPTGSVPGKNDHLVSPIRKSLLSLSRDLSVAPMPTTLAPGVTSIVPTRLEGFDLRPKFQLNDPLLAFRFYLIGRIEYQDAFSAHHFVRFCYLVDQDNEALEACKSSNDEDKTEESEWWSRLWPFQSKPVPPKTQEKPLTPTIGVEGPASRP